MAGGLFQTEADSGLRMLLPQEEQPFPERFGGSVDDHALALVGGGVNEVEIGLAIGTIQADDQVIGMGCVHGYSCELFFELPQA